MKPRKMYRYLMGDGVPAYLNYKPSPAMLASMRAAMTTSRKFEISNDDATAIAYATWLARRDGVELPTVTLSSHATNGSGVRAKVDRDYCQCEGPHWRQWRPRWVTFERGAWRSQYLYNKRGKFKGYGDYQWELDESLARIEIPNWDHNPTVQDCARQVAA